MSNANSYECVCVCVCVNRLFIPYSVWSWFHHVSAAFFLFIENDAFFSTLCSIFGKYFIENRRKTPNTRDVYKKIHSQLREISKNHVLFHIFIWLKILCHVCERKWNGKRDTNKRLPNATNSSIFDTQISEWHMKKKKPANNSNQYIGNELCKIKMDGKRETNHGLAN